MPGTGIKVDEFWTELASIVEDMAPRNRALLDKRDDLQAQIDAWHCANRGQAHDQSAYKAMPKAIGYLHDEGKPFKISIQNVDAEVATIAGAQLVVPVTNARWGSLYDALYGTDVISEDGGAARSGGYNCARGAKVVAHAADILDQIAPLSSGSHAAVTR